MHDGSFSSLEIALMEAGLAQSDPQRVSGAVCFVEAPRLPVEALFANLEAGESVEEFLDNYPASVSRGTIHQALEIQHRLSQAAGARG